MSNYTKFATLISVGDLIFRRNRQVISPTFPYWNLSNSSQVLNSTNFPDYVPYLRNVSANIGFTIERTLPNAGSVSISNTSTVSITGHGLTTADIGKWISIHNATHQDVNFPQYRIIVRIIDANQFVMDELTTVSSGTVAILNQDNITSSIPVSWNANTFTVTNNNVLSRIFLHSLWEDFAFGFVGSQTATLTDAYTRWAMVVNNGSVDRNITGIDLTNRTFTVDGASLGTGSGNVTVFPNRIVGSTTTARHRQILDFTIMSGGLEVVSGLRRRDRMVGHWHEWRYASAATPNSGGASPISQLDPANNTLTAPSNNNTIANPKTDTVNPTSRTDQFNQPSSLGIYLYESCGRYIV